MQVPIGVVQTWFDTDCDCQMKPVAGGLSSSRVWRVVSTKGTHCLKAWPIDSGRILRLTDIHGKLRELQMNGVNYVPQVLSARDGTTWLQSSNFLWEVYTWMPGQALGSSRDANKLLPAAISAIARIHDVWRRYTSYLGASPGVSQRIQTLQQFCQSYSQHKSSQVLSPNLSFLAGQTTKYFERHGRRLIGQLMNLMMPIPVHFAIRDLHSEHILFIDDRVSGIIDFGASKEDEPLLDLVRLLGSVAPLDRDLRYEALDAYHCQRRNLAVGDCLNGDPPEAQENDIRHRFALLDEASTLISALNWWQWLVVETRQFHAPTAQLIARWQNLVQRLECGQW